MKNHIRMSYSAARRWAKVRVIEDGIERDD